jgi:uncharacterized protein HemY
MNDVDRKPIKQGWSAAWLAVKFILGVPILVVVCGAVPVAMAIVGNMVDVCPSGFHVGHFPCDVSLIFFLIVLLIAGLGIWLLLWILRLEVIWNRFQPWCARNARKWHERLDRSQ